MGWSDNQTMLFLGMETITLIWSFAVIEYIPFSKRWQFILLVVPFFWILYLTYKIGKDGVKSEKKE